jgi:hypothetical protein
MDITPLPDAAVGKQWFGKSTTRKIQDGIKEYNAIALNDTNYKCQLKKLGEIDNKIDDLIREKSGLSQQKLDDKMSVVSQLRPQVTTEYINVEKQLNATVDLSDTTGANVGSKAKATALTGAVIGAAIVTSPLLVPVGVVAGIGYGVHKAIKDLNKESADSPLNFALDQKASKMKEIAKAKYKKKSYNLCIK